MLVDVILGLGLSLPIASSVGIGATTGVAQGVSHQQKVNEENRKNGEARMLKFHLDVLVDRSDGGDASRTRRAKEVEGGMVVLKKDKLFVERKSNITRQPENVNSHPFTGFYVDYPDENRQGVRGLVSTISRDPPMLNWIYVDKDTSEIKYSNRSGSMDHMVGTYDWTAEEGPDSCVSLEGWEGWVAVEEAKGVWALYYDVGDDGLKSKKKGRRTIEVRLRRRIISDQEVNKWGLAQEGNIGFKTTREV